MVTAVALEELAGAMPDGSSDRSVLSAGRESQRANRPTGELVGFGALGFGAETALELGDRHAVLELHSVLGRGALRDQGATTLRVG
jgi:hypothetical protein